MSGNRCPFCNRVFARWGNLYNHAEKKHPGSRGWRSAEQERRTRHERNDAYAALTRRSKRAALKETER